MNIFLFKSLNHFAGIFLWFDAAVIFVAEYLGYCLVALFLFFIFFDRDRKMETRIVIFTLFSAGVSRLVFTEIIRFLYFVPRPFEALPDVKLLLHSTEPSFPSGHAAFFFALAMAVFLFHKKTGIAYFLGAIIISLSRIVAGIHWPLDILAGTAVGIISAVLIYYLGRKFLHPSIAINSQKW